MGNDDLSELEVVREQPKLVDPGVAEAPLPDEPKEELGGSPVAPEKPLYYTRAVAVRRRAGLDVEAVPRQSRGVEVRADDVIVVDDEGDEVQVEIPASEAPSLSIKIEHEDIPQDPEEPDVPSLRRSHTEQSAETAVLPQDKGAVS